MTTKAEFTTELPASEAFERVRKFVESYPGWRADANEDLGKVKAESIRENLELDIRPWEETVLVTIQVSVAGSGAVTSPSFDTATEAQYLSLLQHMLNGKDLPGRINPKPELSISPELVQNTIEQAKEIFRSIFTDGAARQMFDKRKPTRAELVQSMMINIKSAAKKRLDRAVKAGNQVEAEKVRQFLMDEAQLIKSAEQMADSYMQKKQDLINRLDMGLYGQDD